MRDEAEGAPTLEMGTLPGADAVEVRVVRANIRAELFPQLAREETIGRYRLQRRLGSGAMGVVFAALDPKLRREVAIKLLRTEDASEADRATRLLREARAMAKLSHPNVVNVFDTGLDGERVYVVMELVPGRSLAAWLQSPRPLDQILEVFVQAGRGLQAAHAAGLVHRDFKPENVLVGDDGRPRVLDFGVARPTEGMSQSELDGLASPLEALGTTITSSGMLVGTPAYMAPEQVLGGRADPRTDQFAFCVCLYEALMGVRPFEADNFPELRRRLLETEPEFPPNRMSPALRELLRRGLARKRESRHPDMARLLERLTRCFESAPPDLAPPSPTTARLPRLDAYLAGLPDGLASHPECTMDVGLLRLCLARYPVGDTLPPSLHPVLDALRGDAQTLPEVKVRAGLAAVCDLQSVEPPDWGSRFKALRRALLHDRLVGPSLAVPGSAHFGRTLVRSWTSLHHGCSIETLESNEQGVDLAIEHPTGLLDELARVDLAAHFEAAAELAGVANPVVRVDDTTPTGARIRVRWAATSVVA